MMFCIVCDKTGPLQCSRCHHRYYCGTTHQRADWSSHRNHCFPLDNHLYRNPLNKMLHEALRLNLFQEYKALETFQEQSHNNAYNEARYYIYRGVVGMILFDPVNGDQKSQMSLVDLEKWDTIKGDIKRGHDLMKATEPGTMWNTNDLLWAFIPKTLWSDIEWFCV